MEYPFSLLTEYFVRENNINVNDTYEIVTIPARELIGANRFDLMAKWIYIDAREKQVDMSWATEVYYDNINAFSCGKFTEPGTEEKNSFQRYLTEFEKLIADIKNNGFDSSKSIIPVGKNNILLDGSHRVAVAAYYHKDITIIRFPKLTREYNYVYFRNYLMSDKSMGYMATYYAHIKSNCYMACLWPVSDLSHYSEVKQEIEQIGQIIYDQDVYLTYQGMKNFMVQIYGHQAWTGSIENHFDGVKGKTDACYKGGQAVRTILFEADSFNEVVEVKRRIRSIFGLENHSVHISDNQAETEAMVDLLYNANSVHFLNFAEPYKYSSIYKKSLELKDAIVQRGYELKRFIIDSSAVLEVCGLREARDVDFLTDYLDVSFDTIDDVDNHESQMKYYGVEIQNLLYNPEHYFCFNGMKYLSVSRLQEMKECRNEPKDIADVELCRKFLAYEKKIPLNFRIGSKEKVLKYQKQYADYGHGSYTIEDYYKLRIRNYINGILVRFSIENIVAVLRHIYCCTKKRKLKNRNLSIIASNCNGGVISNDLGLQHNSPFVNLFLKADDYVKMLSDLKGYMNYELKFVKEIDSIYGEVSYPTAYLKDVKIYFMHYSSEQDALKAWERRKKRINWDNLYILFSDRSGCTQKDLEDFDMLSFKNKVVFTHIKHPEIQSSFYIKGYENEGKVGILSEYKNKYAIKRQLDQFDFVKWFNKKEKDDKR